MIRGGVPQSIALRVTGHETDAMFNRHDKQGETSSNVASIQR